MMYNYWLLEKGYAAKTGPYEKTESWLRRAKGWIRIMYLDALLAMVAYTIVTAAFYVLGAAVLHAQGLLPEKSDIIEVLSKMYTETLGDGARGVFLVGAFVVLFSTLLSALAGWTRLFGDAFAQISTADFHNEKTRAQDGWHTRMVHPHRMGPVVFVFQSPGPHGQARWNRDFSHSDYRCLRRNPFPDETTTGGTQTKQILRYCSFA